MNEREQAIQSFKDGAARIESELEQIPPTNYIVVWADAALRINDKQQIGLGVGGQVYHSSSHAKMLEVAARWRDNLKNQPGESLAIINNKVQCLTAQQWLVQVRIQHAQLMEMIQPSCPK